MNSFTTPAIMLKRIEYGDYDLIINCITLDKGKVSVLAKYAKKSTKRFAGTLELFSLLQVVCTKGRGNLFILKEAVLEKPFAGIREDIIKTAYASYWSELINMWLEEGKSQQRIYHLFYNMLNILDKVKIDKAKIDKAQAGMNLNLYNILFQMKFMQISGFDPNFLYCHNCHTKIDNMQDDNIGFDISKGSIICKNCASQTSMLLSKGTVKQLLWIQNHDLKQALRIKFNFSAQIQSQRVLEAFTIYHLGKEPKSLKFLKSLSNIK